MTRERIDEIKKETIFKAGRKIKHLSFESKEEALFEIGEIFGELNKDLTRQLYRELDEDKTVLPSKSTFKPYYDKKQEG